MAYTNVWDVTAPLDTQAANQGAVDFRATKLDLMQRIASFGAGILAARPTPEATGATADWTGVMYWATDTGQTFRWNGTVWVDITSSIGGTIISSAASIVAPADTNENIIYSGNVQANGLGSTGALNAQFFMNIAGGSGQVDVKFKFGGVVIGDNTFNAAGDYLFNFFVQNASSGVQSTIVKIIDAVGNILMAVIPSTVDTTILEALIITAQKTVGADVITFNNGYAKIQ